MTELTGAQIRLEVAYALPDRQFLVEVEVPAGSTVLDAVRKANLQVQFSALDLRKTSVGIFGRKVRLDDRVSDGDRVEIYRELLVTPMAARRLRGTRKPGDR